MRTGLSIGDFSQITHLSVKTLRRYHEAGLLEPAEVDPHTGYRYYALTQVPTAQVIRHFRDLGMPVREVADVLSAADPHERRALIAGHLERLEHQLEQTQAAVTSLRRLLRPATPPIQVEIRAAKALTTAAICATVDHSEILTWYGDAMTELDQALASARAAPAGPCGGLYDNELFTNERGNAAVYVPVADPPSSGRAQPFTVPAAELALTVHHGPHDDIDVPTANSAPMSPSTPWPLPGRYARPTSPGRGTPTTAPPGAPKSAGQSSAPPPPDQLPHRPHSTACQDQPQLPHPGHRQNADICPAKVVIGMT